MHCYGLRSARPPLIPSRALVRALLPPRKGRVGSDPGCNPGELPGWVSGLRCGKTKTAGARSTGRS
jgi:hypothetical protein